MRKSKGMFRAAIDGVNGNRRWISLTFPSLIPYTALPFVLGGEEENKIG